jgi:hypothetical protein
MANLPTTTLAEVADAPGGFHRLPPTSRREDLIRGAPRAASGAMGERRA